MGMEILRGMAQYFNCVFFGPKVKILISFLFTSIKIWRAMALRSPGPPFLDTLSIWFTNIMNSKIEIKIT